MAKVIAFWGFKGGAGRSLLLANTAAAMAALGKSVLVIDCDLEAPGVGDYFDYPGAGTYSEWRKNKGILDLIVNRREEFGLSDDGNATTEHLYGVLFGEEKGLFTSKSETPYLVDIGSKRAKSAVLKLLGPGSHRKDGHTGQQYLTKLVDFDWNSFLGNDGDRFLASLGEVFRSLQSTFDYVLLDARTGYNFQSILLIQSLATDVVVVGTLAMQSIDGIARMMPVFTDADPEGGRIACHLVISKSVRPSPDPKDLRRVAQRKAERDLKIRLIRDYQEFAGEPMAEFYDLPFVEELHRGDDLFWTRVYPYQVFASGTQTGEGQRAANAAPSPSSPDPAPDSQEQDAVRRYSDEFFRFYGAMTDREVTASEKLQVFETWNPLASKFAGAVVVKETEQIVAEIDGLVRQVESYLRSSPDMHALDSGQEWAPSSGLATINEMSIEARAVCCAEVAKVLEQFAKANSEGNDELKKRLPPIYKELQLDLLPSTFSYELVAAVAASKREKSVENVSPTEDADERLLRQEPAMKIVGSLIDIAYGMALQNLVGAEAKYESARDYLTGLGSPVLDSSLQSKLRLTPILIDMQNGAGQDRVRAVASLGRELRVALTADYGALNGLSAFDAFAPYLRGVVSACLEGENRGMLEELDEIQHRAFDRLCHIRFPHDSGVISSLRNWTEYVRTTMWVRLALRYLRAGRAVTDRPVSTRSLMSKSESESLSEVMDIRGLQISYRRTELGTEPEELILTTKGSFWVAALFMSGDVPAATDALHSVCARLLRSEFPFPVSGESSGNWASLVSRLGNNAKALYCYDLESRLLRLALRLYWPNRKATARDDGFLTTIVAGFSINVMRLGLPMSSETIETVKERASSVPRKNPPEGSSYNWWLVTEYTAAGKYRAALTLLSQGKDLADAETESRARLSWQHHCAFRLGELQQMEEAFVAWCRLVPDFTKPPSGEDLLNDDENTWLVRVAERAEAQLASGLIDDARRSLDEMLTVSEVDLWPRLRVFRAASNVRQILARSIARKEHPGDETGLSRRELARVAGKEIAEYRDALKTEGLVYCDRGFASYLGTDWREGRQGLGMFAGSEFPSPRRLGLAETLAVYAEILMYADMEGEVLAVTDDIEGQILDGYDERDQTSFLSKARLAYCCSIALSSAMRTRFLAGSEKEAARERALRHRDADLSENGNTRAVYYERVFRYCEIEGRGALQEV